MPRQFLSACLVSQLPFCCFSAGTPTTHAHLHAHPRPIFTRAYAFKMYRVQSSPRVLTLLLCAASYSSAVLLYVASYSGTVTTLNLTLPIGDEIAVLEAVSSTDGCAGSPSWLTLDYANSVLYCTDEGLTSGEEGSLSAFSTNEDGSLELLDKVSTVLGPVSAVVYGHDSRGLAVAH